MGPQWRGKKGWFRAESTLNQGEMDEIVQWAKFQAKNAYCATLTGIVRYE